MMMKNLATIISYLFHPLLMATYGCLLLFFGLTGTVYAIFTPLKTKLILTLIIFAFTFLLPVLNLLILHRLKYISSLKLETRKERTFPLLMTSFCYFGLFYMIYDFSIWPVLKLFVFGGGICILMASIVNVWWQISAHMIGIGGLVGILISFCFFKQMPLLIPISGCILLAGCIGFARLFLKAHTPGQVYTGFISGCLIQFSLFLLTQSITFA